MNTASAVALAALGNALPPCDVLNLGYAVLVEGELIVANLERAVCAALDVDPLLHGAWSWHAGRADVEEFGFRAAQHLSRPVTPSSPAATAVWSAGSRHLLLLAIHHGVADGIVLDRVATDISRALRGEPLAAVAFSTPREPSARAVCDATALEEASGPPTMRATCRMVCLMPNVVRRFVGVTRSLRTTPFAGAVACAATAVGAWASANDLNVTIQVAGRFSSAAMRAPGPWYDYTNIRIRLSPDTTLRAVLLDTSDQIVKALVRRGAWASGRAEGCCRRLLVAFDRHPLTALRVPGCHVKPLAVERHPQCEDGVREYLIPTEADIVVFFREHKDGIGVSLFTKTARVSDASARQLLETLLDAIDILCDGGEQTVDRADGTHHDAICIAPPTAWPEAAISDAPLVDAVSPVFRVCEETLSAFATDTQQTLHDWGMPPWHGTL